MKKQFVNNSTRTSLIRFGFILLLSMNLLPAFAHSTSQGEEPQVNIKYIGSAQDRTMFQVDLVNENEENYIFSIQDQDGFVLYKEKIKGKNFTQKFQWDNTDLEATKLVFSLTGEKSKKTQLFEMNTQYRTVQDVVVTKL